jgi:hypothetical protein
VEQHVEGLGEDAAEFAVVFDEHLLEELLIDLASHAAGRAFVGGLDVRRKRDVDLFVLDGCGTELPA